MRDVLARGSPLEGILSGYQHRAGQLAMAEAVEDALSGEHALLVEAGTGTGKTLAYLVPAILSGRKVVISTATRALQEQIYFKDLPLVAELLATFGIRFRAALMKGLSNYLCRRRLKEALVSGDSLAWRFKQWATETEVGDRAELADLAEDDPSWAAVQSSTETRIGTDCVHFEACFVTRMKRDAEEADIIVVNHHLFCADLVLRRAQRERASAIPAYDAVIFDEAHQLEDVATTFFGTTISSARIDALARDARRAFEIKDDASFMARPVTDQLIESARGFFAELSRSLRGAADESPPSSRFGGGGARRALTPRDWGTDLVASRIRLESALAAIAHDAQTRPGPAAEQIARRSLDLAGVVSGDDADGEVAWVETRSAGNVVMGRSPVFVGDVLAESLFGRVRSVICTSATLATPGEDNAHSFDFVRERLGAPHDARAIVVPSPFDFESKAGLYLPRDIPDPSDPRFDEAAATRALELIEMTGGGAFVLCTSLRSMRSMHAHLSRSPRAKKTWGPLLVQGDRPKSMLLSQFRAAKHAVLVATMSFWEGVDVPGAALRLVILDKIPFAVPSDPVVAARCDAVERQGLSAFYRYSVPAAAITLKQGFGRLLRNETDAGLVALLDRRAITKAYGRALLDSLPPARRLRTLEEARTFWMQIAPADDSSR